MSATDPDSLLLFHNPATSNKTIKRRKDIRLGVPQDHTWNTPDDFLQILYQFSPVSLDPCSNENSKVISDKAYRFDRGEDALVLTWRHSFRVKGEWVTLTFVNPPYGDALPTWCQRAIDEARLGAEIVLLTPSRTDTEWFTALQEAATALAFWTGRLYFEIPCKPKEPAPFASLVTYFGPSRYRFADVFSPHAKVWIL